MGIFPNEASAIRLTGAILADLHDEWQANQRRYLSEDSMNLLHPQRDNRLFALDEIVGYVVDEFSCQRAVTDCIAQQGERALAGESCLLRDPVGDGIVQYRLRWHCRGNRQHCCLAHVAFPGHELCGELPERRHLLFGA